MISRTVLRYLVDVKLDKVNDCFDAGNEREAHVLLGSIRALLDAINVLSPDLNKGEMIHRLVILKREYHSKWLESCEDDSHIPVYYYSAYQFMENLIENTKAGL